MTPQSLLLIGASVRAAAGSALRAGLRPFGVDLFADADLEAMCPARRLPGKYPRGFIALADEAPPGPWLYTGGLENWPKIIQRLSRRRPLWGNNPETVRRVRSPENVSKALRARGLPCPWVRVADDTAPRNRAWLLKPRRGAGGRRIAPWKGNHADAKDWYLQEFVDGASCAGVFVGDGRCALLLGATQQLVGEAWLHARPFQYCGSVGPLALEPATVQALEQLGQALAEEFRLRGLFGVDFMLRDGVPWPVEINPRYPASVEVLEYATGIRALDLHRQVFERGTFKPASESSRPRGSCVGKAIVFAGDRLTFPPAGPWQDAGPPLHMPAFADIPHAGQTIPRRQPILTLFAQAESVAACLDRLKRRAQELERDLVAGRPQAGRPEAKDIQRC